MGWLQELHGFHKYIEDYSERKLDKDKIVRDFLEFMKVHYGYENEYFTNGYHEHSQKYKDMDD